MKEKYLHYLWQNKLLPYHQMTLLSGESFAVIYPGDYNENESGPDFFNAQIQIDGLVWNGNVELHVRSSDWYRHGHQFDPAYSNVILHVVYEFDKDVIIDNRTIPALELKNVISVQHYKGYTDFFRRKNKILCASQFTAVDAINRINMQERAIIKRLNRKTEFLDEFRGDPHEAFYILVARAMGAKVNQLPFEELARRLPYRKIKNVRVNDRELVLLQTGGFVASDKPSELLSTSKEMIRYENKIGTVNPHSWKRGGLRPGAAPEVRIRQFAALTHKLDPELFLQLSDNLDLREYFHGHFSINKSYSLTHPEYKKLTKWSIDMILINAVAPFLWWFGQIRKDDLLVELAFLLLRQIPPEQNSIIAKWERLGLNCENAFETQAMLEIFNEFCFRKKCLSCGIGKSILGK